MAAGHQFDMPRTQGGAPPSFYNSVASMPGQQGVQPGGQPGQQSASQQQPGTQKNADSDKYIEMTTKLLAVLAQMQSMKPNGMDVTKYTQAAADSMKEALKNVLGTSGDQAAGMQPDANSTGSGAQPPATSAMSGDQTGSTAGGAVTAPQ